MQIRTYDELTAEQHRERSLVHLSAFGGIFSSSEVEMLRRPTNFFSEYAGVFALDRGHVIGQVYVMRIPYRFPEGPGMLGGIVAVGTHPDRGRAGVARSLLEEAHVRERAAGVERMALWTNRSWGAHRLYERLGYRDVYAPPWLVRPPVGARRRPPPRGIRPGRRTDLRGIDALHRRVTEGRIGFAPRLPGFSTVEARLDQLDPAKSLRVATSDGGVVGYASVDKARGRILCQEIVATSARVRDALVRSVSERDPKLPSVFQHTPVTDEPSAFRFPGSVRSDGGWYVLMGCAPGRDWTEGAARRDFGTDDPRFVCLGRDRF